MPDFQKITVSVVVRAPVDRAWEVFTSPEAIVDWNFASDDWHCPTARSDLREGGFFNYRMESKDRAAGFDFSGTFTEVRAGERIAFELGDGRAVKVEFRAVEVGTEVVETFDAETENPLEPQRFGWQAILDNYRKRAERGA